MFKADIASRVLDIFSSLPKEIVVLIISALPVVERTGAPLAIAKYHMSLWEALLFSSVGMFLPVVPILLLLEPVSNWLIQHSKLMARFLGWLFDHTRKKHSEKIDRYGAIGVFLFVATPLPGTGSWSGALLAYLFDIQFKYAFTAILAGVLVSGFLAAAGTVGAVALVAKVEGALKVLALIGVGAIITGWLLKKRKR